MHLNEVLLELEFEFNCVLAQKILYDIYFMTREEIAFLLFKMV